MPGALNSFYQLTLVLRTGSGYPTGDDLALFSDETMQQPIVFVIDVQYPILTEATNFLTIYQHILPLKV